ncbi:MAG: DUF2851 family protein [Bacteroidales bacterium]|nr:DUF2851 family protein [Bacteroidales bacterium]
MGKNNIPEAFFHFLWKYRSLKPGLNTTKGELLEIIDPGQHNHDSGPDFLMAKIRIGNTLWAGNVEIHIRGSDWYRHGHQSDSAYNNVVLHIVAENDIIARNQAGHELQTLCLKDAYRSELLERYNKIIKNLLWVPCMHMINRVERIIILNTIHAKAIERLQEKSILVQDELKKCNNDWEECCYRLISKQFGSKINTSPFEMLAETIPAKILMKHHHDLTQLESLLFGQSGLLNTRSRENYPKNLKKEHHFLAAKYGLTPMPGYLWKFMRLRPAAFPGLRIAQLAYLYHLHQSVFQELLEKKSIAAAVAFFELEASTYWDHHYHFNKKSKYQKKRFGLQATHLLLINAIVPLVYLYGEQMNKGELCERAVAFMESLPPEGNAVVRRWKGLGIEVSNALETQGLLQMKKALCDARLCLECPIGHALLKE